MIVNVFILLLGFFRFFSSFFLLLFGVGFVAFEIGEDDLSGCVKDEGLPIGEFAEEERVEKLFAERKEDESAKKLGVNCGTPQLTQCHEASLWPKAEYTPEFMPRHRQ